MAYRNWSFEVTREPEACSYELFGLTPETCLVCGRVTPFSQNAWHPGRRIETSGFVESYGPLQLGLEQSITIPGDAVPRIEPQQAWVTSFETQDDGWCRYEFVCAPRFVEIERLEPVSTTKGERNETDDDG